MTMMKKRALAKTKVTIVQVGESGSHTQLIHRIGSRTVFDEEYMDCRMTMAELADGNYLFKTCLPF